MPIFVRKILQCWRLDLPQIWLAPWQISFDRRQINSSPTRERRTPGRRNNVSNVTSSKTSNTVEILLNFVTPSYRNARNSNRGEVGECFYYGVNGTELIPARSRAGHVGLTEEQLANEHAPRKSSDWLCYSMGKLPHAELLSSAIMANNSKLP